MSYLRGADRSEAQLLPPCLDDYVAANAPARFIDAYPAVGGCELSAFLSRADVKHAPHDGRHTREATNRKAAQGNHRA